ncbi:hypothetical protein NOK12_16720 [Nocardioides sp. OK12]|uniref:hypothetical protein n=1 Tax=Nocardioides sp. OK12 TaxID=2758661 RepID=UPI0021C3A4D3|nr:hypothetical protein [Nocardioides sp. OK12]GHJ59154.1 hypothetical protein NOK12_16720 [Nocardioides sp. OK12]
MTADRWTHHDPAVRALIRAAQAEAWDSGAIAASPYGGGYLRSLLIQNPHRDLDALGFLRAALAPAPTEDADVRQIGSDERVEACEHSPQYQRSECAPCGHQVAWCERCEVDLCGCTPHNDYDGAAADRRSLHDPDSGRIDNWSER